ncbi:hypothetical protein AB6735_27300 [Mucilaginibacter sp. RCC_168]|uniref:hypothetical protein n=1 Tax=Mucilaginibacter sp. RCC_168 TaxID=3239221 RepID=UPI003526541C
MRKLFALTGLLLIIGFTSFAQTIENPVVGIPEDLSARITKIETNTQFTAVSFEYTASGDNAWVQLNKEIFIQTDVNNEHYNYVKSDKIAIAPAKHFFAKAGDKLVFKVYFKKIPANAKTIDVVERPGFRTDGITFFNYYNISLTQSLPAGAVQKVKVTNVVLMPPPPVENLTDADQTLAGQNVMANAMNMMGPMYATMAKSLMDSQLDYYKQPGKIEELAKVNKQYFDALKKEGFTEDQALRIITTGGILSSITGGSGK